jgi:hypothetical protein
MNSLRSTSRLALAGSTVALAACGGGGSGGIVSTPNPPGSSYSTLDQLTGNQTFQSGGIHWSSGQGGISGRGTDSFGSGLVFSYNAASDTFSVTTPTNVTATFDASTFQPGQSNSTTRVFVNGTQQSLRLTRPSINNVTLSYLEVANFVNPATSTSWTAVGGVPTQNSDVPRTGSATYTASTGANIFTNGASTPHSTANATGTTATFSANFAANTVATSVHLVGAQTNGGAAVDFGTFNGSGTISSTGPGFAGTFTGTTGAGFSGAFFGPQGAEAGYTYNFVGTYSGGSLEAFGATTAKKN